MEYTLGALVNYLGEERTTAVAWLYNMLGRLKLSLHTGVNKPVVTFTTENTEFFSVPCPYLPQCAVGR